jgi:hypothetical protein
MPRETMFRHIEISKKKSIKFLKDAELKIIDFNKTLRN